MQYPPGPDISDDERALDIELIATLYRAIGDLNAFDAMVDAVQRVVGREAHLSGHATSRGYGG